MTPFLLLFLALLPLFPSCSLIHQDLPNEAPVLQLSQADTTRVGRGGKVQLRVRASDEDDDPLSYTWTAFGAGSFTDSASATTQWIAPATINGASEFFVLSVTISDHQPETEDLTETFLIEVVQRPPSLALTPDTTVAFSAPIVELEALGDDPDNDALEYRWEQLAGAPIAPQIERLDNRRSRLRFIPFFPGDYLFAVQVGDGVDTAGARIQVRVVAAETPLAGSVPLELLPEGGSPRAYQIDTYEYPNQKNLRPNLVLSFFEAVKICEVIGKRLCTAEEWRNACQGEERRPYSSADDPAVLGSSFGRRFCNTPGSQVAGNAPDPEFLFDYLAQAGTFPNCGTRAGVHDLTGNAAEWVWADDEATTGRFTLSSALGNGECGEFSEPLPPLPADFDFTSQAIERLRQDSAFDGYFRENIGLRCCR